MDTITRGYPSTHTPYQVTFSNYAVNQTIGTYYGYGPRGQVIDRGDADGHGGHEYTYDALGRLTRCRGYTYGMQCEWVCDPYNGCHCQSQPQKTYTSEDFVLRYCQELWIGS